MKPNRTSIFVTIALLLVGLAWLRFFWFTEVFHTHQSNEPHRTALVQIRDAVDVGASHAEVLAAYWQYRTDRLRLSAESPAEWFVEMPGEFGAKNWTLHIKFADNQVASVRVRTSDGPPPKDGPADK